MVLWGQLSNLSPSLKAVIRAFRCAVRGFDTEIEPVAGSVRCRLGACPDEIRAFIEGYEAGKSAKEVGAEAGVSRQTVVRHLKQSGVTIRYQPMPPEVTARAIALYKQGWSLVRVGDHLGWSPTAIHDVLERAGVPRRDTHGR